MFPYLENSEILFHSDFCLISNDWHWLSVLCDYGRSISVTTVSIWSVSVTIFLNFAAVYSVHTHLGGGPLALYTPSVYGGGGQSQYVHKQVMTFFLHVFSVDIK